MKYLLFCFSIILFFSCKQNNADLIVKNATIYTVNNQFEIAQVIVIKDGIFIAVGGDTLLNKYHSANTIDANKQFIYPGFIDAHCHFTGYAMDKYKLALFGTKSFNEIIEKLNQYAQTNKREWIEGRGWDQNDWTEKSFPTKDTLDKLFPNTPVFLMRIDGHAVLCNQTALDKANINLNTKINGGEIEIKNGKLTGILIDNAVDIVKNILPQRTEKEIIEDFIIAQQDCVSLGLTTVVDCGIKKNTVAYLQHAYKENKLQIKNTVLLSDEKENYDTYLHQTPYKDKNFHIAGFKVYADGALGSRGAYMIQPYNDKHNYAGLLLKPLDSIQQIATKVFQSKYQLCTHAIGDAANRDILKIYANTLKTKNDRRWRIEHAQVIDPLDFHYFGQYSIIPSVQPTHATSDMYWAEDRIGKERMKNAYAYKKLLNQNNWLPLGTDFPVEYINPIYTFYAAVFRFDKNEFPAQGFEPENALSRQEALKGITIWAAKSVFEEQEKGSIEVGKMADFVILPIDIMKADAKTIYQTTIYATYINGTNIYQNKTQK